MRPSLILVATFTRVVYVFTTLWHHLKEICLSLFCYVFQMTSVFKAYLKNIYSIFFSIFSLYIRLGIDTSLQNIQTLIGNQYLCYIWCLFWIIVCCWYYSIHYQIPFPIYSLLQILAQIYSASDSIYYLDGHF